MAELDGNLNAASQLPPSRPWRDSFILLRLPFSLLLLPVYLFALAQAPALKPGSALAIFVILHLLIYPASNGYNSYVDRDTEAIGGLRQPPPPPRRLFWLTLGMDLIALIWSAFVSLGFALGVGLCVLLSRAYSAEWPRLKRFPLGSFVLVFFFQGAFIFWTVLWGVTPDPLRPQLGSMQTLLQGLGASCLIGGAYPISQIYQHASDAERGDLTLSRVLGYRGTLIFCAGLYILGALCLFMSLSPADFSVLGLCLMPVGLYFGYWSLLIWRNPQAANYTHTMRMNALAALCLSLGFGLTGWF